jgi:hypothetical protein
MSQLVQKLSQGDHAVEIILKPERSAKVLKEYIDRGYVNVKFTETQGGTELTVRLDKEASNLNADFEKGTGQLRFVGNHILDYVKVQCIAEIDLASFTGKGHLRPV